jgi:cytochrome bd-type quinol oxidase subunit 1
MDIDLPINMETISPYLGGLLMGLFVIIHFVLIGRGVGGSAVYICAVRKSIKSDKLYYGSNLDPLKSVFAIGILLGSLLERK